MRNALIILTLIFVVISFKAPVAWVFVILFGTSSLYCILTGKGKVGKRREKGVATQVWEDTVGSVLKDCPFCKSKIMKSASECPYCGVLLEDNPVERMDVPDKNAPL